MCNRPIRGLFGIGQGRKALEFDKIVDIHAPIEEVFRLWSDFSSFPRFLTHVCEVRVTDSRSHWVVEGPAGTRVSWDAELTRFEKNRLIAWRSLPGEIIGNAGIIRFEPLPDGATRLHIHLSYNPPGGVLGHTIAALFGKDPQRALDDDLVRFKSLLEQGKATGRGRQIHIEDLTGEGFTGHEPEAAKASKDQGQPSAPKTFH